jgi:ParB family chromosome partitioning protein
MGKHALSSFDDGSGDIKRQDMFLVPPEALTIVTDRAHPLFDERALWPVSEPLKRSIVAIGIKEQVLVVKDGDRLLVVDGRQRVKAALAANDDLRAYNSPGLVKVPCTICRGNELDHLTTAIATNEIRQDDDVITKCHKLVRYLDLGHDEEEAALAFGVDRAQIRNWLDLAGVAPQVQQAVQNGELSKSAALDEAKKPRAQQSPQKRRKPRTTMRTLKEVQRLRAYTMSDETRQVLEWILKAFDEHGLENDQ